MIFIYIYNIYPTYDRVVDIHCSTLQSNAILIGSSGITNYFNAILNNPTNTLKNHIPIIIKNDNLRMNFKVNNVIRNVSAFIIVYLFNC